MTSLTVEGSNIEIKVLGWHRFWACCGSVTVPIAGVKSVESIGESEINALVKGWGRLSRLAGTFVPCRIAAGMFQSEQGGALFFDVKRPFDRMIHIEAESGEFRHVFIDVEHPDSAIQAIRAATGANV